MDAAAQLLSQLVAIPSVNPMGRALSGPGIFETGMSDFLESWFRDLGVSCVRDEVAPGRTNIIARYDAPGARRVLLYDVHQDTVPVDNMIIDPFRAAIEGDRLYGRGSCDIKGAMASILLAFRRLVQERPAGSASVVVACTVDEEFTHLGASKLAREAVAPDVAIIAEPTKLNVVNCHKGAARWKIRTSGVACHSSTPWLGANAIYRMRAVLPALASYASDLHKRQPDPALGPPTLSVGRIEGGQSVNVVPDGCAIEIDRRVLPGETALDCVGDVRRWLTERLPQAQGSEPPFFMFDDPWLDASPLSPRSGQDWVGLVCDSVAESIGRSPQVMGVPYGTDAGALAKVGWPCLVLGPGDIAQAHTKDEWVDLNEIRTAVDVYYDLARRLG